MEPKNDKPEVEAIEPEVEAIEPEVEAIEPEVEAIEPEVEASGADELIQLQNRIAEFEERVKELEKSLNDEKTSRYRAERSNVIRDEMRKRGIPDNMVDKAIHLSTLHEIDFYDEKVDFESAINLVKQENPFLIGGGTKSNLGGRAVGDNTPQRLEEYRKSVRFLHRI